LLCRPCQKPKNGIKSNQQSLHSAKKDVVTIASPKGVRSLRKSKVGRSREKIKQLKEQKKKEQGGMRDE